MQVFCDTYNLKCLVKEPTCYKNMDNPSCIDLILTIKFLSFQQPFIIETGLSDFHKLTTTIIEINIFISKNQTLFITEITITSIMIFFSLSFTVE